MGNTTTKEDGNLALALDWLNAPREVPNAQEAAEHEAAWFDATLDADRFFAMEHVTPVQAAMLLCQLNPFNSTESDAESCTTGSTGPRDFKRLRLTFADINQSRPARRSLPAWMAIAAGANLTVHPWAQRYAQLHGLYGPPKPEAETELAPAQLSANGTMVSTTVNMPSPSALEPSPAPSLAPTTEPVVTVSASIAPGKVRRDLLTPVIEAAQKLCNEPFDPPAVWAALLQMAQDGKRPLVGVTETGIKWNDAEDNPKFLSLKNLRERVRRSKKKAESNA